jgi:transposase
VTASDALRAEVEPRTDFALVTAWAELEVTGELADPEVAMRHARRALARRWLALHEEIKLHTGQLKTLTGKTAPALVATFGIGFDRAAELLTAAGDNTAWVRSQAAYAKLCGACPIPASSGKGTRHRLNRGGNRQLNAAIHRVAITQLRAYGPAQALMARRITAANTKPEALRILKRHLADVLYAAMCSDEQAASTTTAGQPAAA